MRRKGLQNCDPGESGLKIGFATRAGSAISAAPFRRSARGCGRQGHAEYTESITFMSQHSSLRAASTTGTKRNVLKRFERVAVLKSRNQWKDGERVTGLRKTRPPE